MDETPSSAEADYFGGLAALVTDTQANLNEPPPSGGHRMDAAPDVLALAAGMTTFRERLKLLNPPASCRAAHTVLIEVVAREIEILSRQSQLSDVIEAAGLSECLADGQEALQVLARLAADSGVPLVLREPPRRFGWA
jgi:hypothetical protein